MRNWGIKLATVAGVCAMALTAAGNAEAGTTHYLTIVPGPTLINKAAEVTCIKANIFGGLELDIFSGQSQCPWANAQAFGWSAWAGGDIALPWAANPSAGSSAIWNVVVPANTEFRARVVLMDQNGGATSVGAWVTGGGLKEGFADQNGFGGMLINFQMRSFRANATSPRPTPVLHTVAGLVYSS
jgi:hypothetical protein